MHTLHLLMNESLCTVCTVPFPNCIPQDSCSHILIPKNKKSFLTIMVRPKPDLPDWWLRLCYLCDLLWENTPKRGEYDCEIWRKLWCAIFSPRFSETITITLPSDLSTRVLGSIYFVTILRSPNQCYMSIS